MEKNEFGAFMRQYQRLVYTICWQFTRDHHTAEDLCQEAFLSAYTHMDSCPPENPKAWVARIATNKAKDYLKSAYSRKMISASDETMPQDKAAMYIQQPHPEQAVESRDACLRITHEIDSLRQPYGHVAALHFFGHQSVPEIAVQLGRSSRTVQTQLYRAKMQLRQRLADEREAPRAC